MLTMPQICELGSRDATTLPHVECFVDGLVLSVTWTLNLSHVLVAVSLWKQIVIRHVRIKLIVNT